ncbi:hypothetical protein HY357_00495 [Candidatus Roizmanbacteria bacterium]|nr:hypothetical protein [Candidatus Roizmanbacteria bacterium]
MRVINYRLHKKLEETFVVEPNNLGTELLTFLYHRVTSFLKQMPFIFIIPMSIVGAIFLYILFGSLIVKLVTLLQYGF